MNPDVVANLTKASAILKRGKLYSNNFNGINVSYVQT